MASMYDLFSLLEWITEHHPKSIVFATDGHTCKTIENLIILGEYESIGILYGMPFLYSIKAYMAEFEYYEQCAIIVKAVEQIKLSYKDSYGKNY